MTETVTLNNGVELPALGLGVFQTPPDETLHGFEKSARKLGVDQIDLLLLHQALPSAAR